MRTAKKLLFAFCSALVLSSCSKPAVDEPSRLIETSMIQLLAHPQRYNGKRVVVIGFFYSSGEEDDALYLTPDDARINNRQSSIFIGGYNDGGAIRSHEFEKRQSNYAAVSGEFISGPAGHMGLWPGMIYPVYSISVFDPETEKWIVEQPVPYPPRDSGTED